MMQKTNYLQFVVEVDTPRTTLTESPLCAVHAGLRQRR